MLLAINILWPILSRLCDVCDDSLATVVEKRHPLLNIRRHCDLLLELGVASRWWES